MRAQRQATAIIRDRARLETNADTVVLATYI